MRTAIILAVILFVPTIAFSATIIIPDDQPTIQAGIDAAVNGDTVLVKPGTYVENIDFKGKAITVMGEQGADVTVIDGDPRPCMGTVDMGMDEFTGTHSFECDTFTLSEATGGILHLDIYGGIENAGRNYLIFGSISGTAPGTLMPGGLKVLPINWDLFTKFVADVNYPDSIIFKGFFGTLDSNGQMDAVFNTNEPVPGGAGYTISFAYPLQGPPWDFVSNPVGIEIVQ